MRGRSNSQGAAIDHSRANIGAEPPAKTGAANLAAALAAVLLRVAFAFLIMFAGMTLLQDYLLYMPAKAPVAEVVSERLRPWPSAEDFRGLVAAPEGAARATAIVFHGNAGHAGHRDYYASALTRLGLRVILAEYPGYGPRGGVVGEQSMVADAEQTIALAHRHYGAPLLLIGESLGAGVATAAAVGAAEDGQSGQTAGLLLITPWDRLENIAAFHYPWLPVRWLLRDGYDNSAHLRSFAGPVVVVVAEHDRIVPARFGEALYRGLPKPKRLMVVEGARHNDWVARVDGQWWRDAIDFLLEESGVNSENGKNVR